jgi:hypothetical protein
MDERDKKPFVNLITLQRKGLGSAINNLRIGSSNRN